MKVALCCIVKDENLYLREFVEYYKRLQVDHIIIYDNNEKDGENPHDVLEDYVQDGYVTIINERGAKSALIFVYEYCCDNFGQEYDWIMFFDVDEFLTLVQENDIHEFLSSERYSGFDMIHINWICYGDNDQVFYEDKPVLERFTLPVTPFTFNVTYPTIPENAMIKSIVKTKGKSVKWFNEMDCGTMHTPCCKGLTCCNEAGNVIEDYCMSFYPSMSYKYAYIKHFYTKTIEEYATKTLRGYANTSWSIEEIKKKHYNLDKFFKYSEETSLKKYIYEKTIEKIESLRDNANPTVYVYVLCYNEMKIIDFVIDYWKRYATKVIVYDNGSTDGSVLKLSLYDWIEIRHFDTSDTMDDIKHLLLKEEIWKECKGKSIDFVLVSDFDEVLYSKDIIGDLKRMKHSKYTMLHPIGCEAISLTFPQYDSSKLLHQYDDVYITYNNQWFSKNILFKPDEIEQIHYTMVGCHSCEPVGNVKILRNEIRLIHIKKLGLDHIKSRNIMLDRRQCENSKYAKFNLLYKWNDDKLLEDFTEAWKNKNKIV